MYHFNAPEVGDILLTVVTMLFHRRVAPCRRNITVLKPMSWQPFMPIRTYTVPAFSKRQTTKTAQRALNICNTAEPERWLTQSSNALLKIEVMDFNIQLTTVFSFPLRQHPVPLAILPQQFMSCGNKNCSEKKMCRFPRKWSRFDLFLREIPKAEGRCQPRRCFSCQWKAVYCSAMSTVLINLLFWCGTVQTIQPLSLELWWDTQRRLKGASTHNTIPVVYHQADHLPSFSICFISWNALLLGEAGNSRCLFTFHLLISILLVSIRGQQKQLYVVCRVPSSPWHLFFRLRWTQCFPVWNSNCHRCEPYSSSLNSSTLLYPVRDERSRTT